MKRFGSVGIATAWRWVQIVRCSEGRLTKQFLVATLCAVATVSAYAKTSSVAFPYYNGQQALVGLYQHHLQAKAVAFDAQATALQQSVAAWCQAPSKITSSTSTGTSINASSVRQRWRDALLAWQALSSPAVGPVIDRRAQLSLDFWPPREALLQKAIAAKPAALADLERIGTPAKGFAALDRLLTSQTRGETGSETWGEPASVCLYSQLLAQDIAAQAHVLRQDFDRAAQTDWAVDEAVTQAAFEQWLNQWLGGLERLRWLHMAQPVQRIRTTNMAKTAAFARLAMADNVLDWQAQWRALLAQARLNPTQYQQPPQPNEALIPIEALLLGRGQIDLAKRWVLALNQADAAMAKLATVASNKPRAQQFEASVLATSKALQQVANLYQTEVAAALDVALGFSDADGD